MQFKEFGYFEGLPYEESRESFDSYREYQNTISKDTVIAYMEKLGFAITSLPSYDIFTGEKLQAGEYIDGEFSFPYEFLHYYKNYDIGIPYEYEEYLKEKGIQ